MAWSAEPAALALLLQAGVIGAVLMKNQNASFQTASLSTNEPAPAPITRDLGVGTPPRALVRFAPDAPHCRHQRAARQLPGLDRRRRQDGLFRLQFGNKAMGKDEVAA